MRIYKHNIKVDGEKRESLKWYCDVRFSDGRRYRLPLHEDEKTAGEIAAKVEGLIRCYEGGEIPPVALQQWVNQRPAAFQAKLAKWGLIGTARVASRTGLDKHLNDWRGALLAGGITKKQADQDHHQAGRVLSEAGIRSLADLDGNRVISAIGRLQSSVRRRKPKGKGLELVKTGPASPNTKLHHLRSVKKFAKWATIGKLIPENPLAHLELKRVQVENPRRAFTVEELSYLLAFVQTAPDRWGVPGPERALVYELAANTGLRRDEIKSLTRRHFDFKRLFVRVEGKDTKNGKPALLPVKAALMDRIKNHLSNRMPTAAAFTVPEAAARMLKRDMDDARVAWIKAAKQDPEEHRQRADSDFLRAITHEGKIDFHSLRHTFGTLLAASGVHPKVAMDLMRHSDINLTMALYTHSNQDQAKSAISALPELTAMSPRGKRKQA